MGSKELPGWASGHPAAEQHSSRLRCSRACVTWICDCVQDKCHPQTIAVCQSRADGLGLKVVVGDEASFSFDKDVSGVLLQYPATDGSIHDYKVTHLLSCLPPSFINLPLAASLKQVFPVLCPREKWHVWNCGVGAS